MSELKYTNVFPVIEDISEQKKFFKEAFQLFEKRILKLTDTSWEYWIRGNNDKALVFFHGAMIGPEMFFYPAYVLSKYFKVIVVVMPDDVTTIEEVIHFYELIIFE